MNKREEGKIGEKCDEHSESHFAANRVNVGDELG